jgi:DNA invertase Pin-like site-specific DNA recombinase
LGYAKDTCKKRAACYDSGMTIFGYARVSTDGQSVDAQVKQLRDAGAEKIFRETASGAKTDRREQSNPLMKAIPCL